MIEIRIQGDRPIIDRMNKFPQEWALILEKNLITLGRRVAYLMKQELKPVRYTGATEQSVTFDVDLGQRQVSIFPTTPQALWIRTGTRPHWAPSAPLKRWAQVKLGDERLGYAVQRTIAKYGTSKFSLQRYGTKDNPYPERTLMRGDTQAALINTARRLGADLVAYIGGEKV